MSRINTNVSSLIAQRVLKKNNNELNNSMQRLATGLKINSGQDDPAGLIASENLRAEKAGLGQAVHNAERASNVIGTAEGGLNEISSLMTELQTLTTQTANTGGLSPEETQANQLQVDSILSTINRVAGSTQFEGMKLLNGNYSYTTSSVATSAFSNMQVNAARLPDGQKVNVVVNVTASAEQGAVTFKDSTATALASNVTVTVAGNLGTEQLTFAKGTNLSAVAAAVNGLKDVTGVQATMSNSNQAIRFNSKDYGSSQYVSVQMSTSHMTASMAGGTNGKAFGKDAQVTVNGGSAEANGTTVSYRTSDLDIEFDMSNGLNAASKTKNFAITGGGATFMLGSKVGEGNKASIGILNVSSGSLGDASLGFISEMASGKSLSMSSGQLGNAQKTLDRAIKQVSQLRGRLGAFQKFTIGSTVNSLGVALENASAAESAIRDTDFSEETAKMTRSQVLAQAATSILSQANSSPQSALSLLRG